MNILDKAIATSTHLRGSNDFEQSALLAAKVEETGETSLGTSENEEFTLQVKVGVNFWCNQAQYESALAQARITLVRRLYQDVLHISAEIKSAVFDGDAERSLYWCQKLEKEILE